MILVTGATGYTGRFLLSRLREMGHSLRLLVRKSSRWKEIQRPGDELFVGDLEEIESVRKAFAGVQSVIHLAHIRHAATVLECIGEQVERVVLLSSLRRFSRVPSPSVEEVIAGEECAFGADLPFVILRPSMIYGPGDDRNISRLVAYLRRCRWLPIVGNGGGMQQPVHVEDVVEGILAATFLPEIEGAYDLAGADPISYGGMVDLIGETIGVRPIKLHIPLRFGLFGARLCRILGFRIGIEREQLLRLQEDKVFAIGAAQRDLGYAPRGLREGLEAIYGGEEG